MIRVDYSGLDWEKIGNKTDLKCKKCGGDIYLDTKYEARFCSSCGIWIDKKCNLKNCWYCRNRPDYPIYVLYNKRKELKENNKSNGL